jgi:hypothetical protein
LWTATIVFKRTRRLNVSPSRMASGHGDGRCRRVGAGRSRRRRDMVRRLTGSETRGGISIKLATQDLEIFHRSAEARRRGIRCLYVRRICEPAVRKRRSLRDEVKHIRDRYAKSRRRLLIHQQEQSTNSSLLPFSARWRTSSGRPWMEELRFQGDVRIEEVVGRFSQARIIAGRAGEFSGCR